jgi:hypothetical protein
MGILGIHACHQLRWGEIIPYEKGKETIRDAIEIQKSMK